MNARLTDSELKIMNVLWEREEITAKEIYDALKDSTGWSVNTTYTLIKRCISKGAAERLEPRFRCRAVVDKAQVQQSETEELIGKLFDGSADKLFAALVGSRKVSRAELERLRRMVDELE